MIDPRFVYLAALLSIVGAWSYIHATVRGSTSPNRVTWGLWGVEGILAFGIEIQQRVGLASLMTLMLGVVPIVVVLVSFRNSHSVWKIGRFDVVCGLISVAGLIFWALINQPTIALISFVAADQAAALPTIRKAWIAPRTESPRVFILGSVNCGITLLTLKVFTTAGVLFPGVVMVADFVLATLIVGHVGPRLRGEWRDVPKAQVAGA